MGTCESEIQTLRDSVSWLRMQIAFLIGYKQQSENLNQQRLGRLQATCDQTRALCEQVLITLAAQPPPRSHPSGILSRLLRGYGRAKEYWEHFERLRSVLSVLRAIRWGSLAWTVGAALRWLGAI